MIDYEFVARMLKKQLTHYEGFIRATEKQLAEYDRQLGSFERLIATGNTRWKQNQKEVEFKKTEAIVKLSEAATTVAKIKEQLKEEEFPQYEEARTGDKGFFGD